MKHLKILFLLLILISCNEKEKQFISKDEFILIEEKISPNKNYKIIQYQFDQGALGESRIFWAILPNPFDEKKALNNYIIPDGYKALSWTNKNEAIIEKWVPYYYKDQEIDLKTGDVLNGVLIRIK